ncbi:hemerythrin domain-containing protein [Streptosporangium saharense]|uniref:Hemerythrin-like domain-containing protein n=1 Tax=Streptosporangium saharense TaxID=1706840 RepID=A0A7W7VR76_9ACTN|nr:hemerythrin domain-containing protein [Streptosporangium saharense]MBB4919065.1 hemerythrin-like domain-containing protein [Streptosporangium saharense]
MRNVEVNPVGTFDSAGDATGRAGWKPIPEDVTMCNYCGCRQFPLIGSLSQEHWDINECAGALRRAVSEGRHDDAVKLLAELLALLVPHTATEESGLFAELRADGTLADEVDRLCAEHDDIHGVLGAIDPAAPDWPAVLAALDLLREHIDHEEHGLFPAAVIMLPFDAWDRITPDTTGVPNGLQGRVQSPSKQTVAGA